MVPPHPEFGFVPLGERAIKGKGMVSTYLVKVGFLKTEDKTRRLRRMEHALTVTCSMRGHRGQGQGVNRLTQCRRVGSTG
eukprot:215242-Pelagomonas_calceolata.AAC.1